MRIWYTEYRDFQWLSDDGTQTIEIRLANEMFERELQSTRIRMVVASSQMSYDLSRIIYRGGDLPAGHLMPGRRVPEPRR